MLIVALVLAVIGLAALVTAVVSSNEIIAWVCIGASALGVVLLVVDAIRERQRRAAEALTATTEPGQEPEPGIESEQVVDEVSEDAGGEVPQAEIETDSVTESIQPTTDLETPDPALDEGTPDETPEIEEPEILAEEIVEEDHPEEVVHDEPEFDTYGDDEPEYPPSAEESALHTVDESELDTVRPEER